MKYGKNNITKTKATTGRNFGGTGGGSTHGSASNFLSGSDRGVVGTFGRAGNAAGRVVRPFNRMLLFSSQLAGLAGLMGAVGNSEGVQSKPWLDKSVGRVFRAGGRWLEKPMQLASYSVEDAAQKRDITGSIDTLATTGEKIYKAADKALGIKNRAEKRHKRHGIKLKDFREKILQKDGAAVGGVLDLLDQAKSKAGSDYEAASELVERAHIELAEMDGVTRSQKRAIGRYTDRIFRNTELSENVRFWDDPKKNIEQSIRNTSVAGAINKTVQAVNIANEIYGDYQESYSAIASLKLMVADLKGEDPKKYSGLIGTFKVLTGDLPPLAKMARKEMFRNLLPRIFVTGVTSFGYKKIDRAVSRVSGNNQLMGTALSAAVFRGINSITGVFASKYNLLEAYSAARVAEESAPGEAKQQFEASDYLYLIAAGSKTVRDNGGLRNAQAQLVANLYAQRQTPVSEVMHNLNGGEAKMKEIYAEAEQLLLTQRKEQKSQATQAEKNEPSVEKNTPASANEQEQQYWRNKAGGQDRKSPLEVVHKKKSQNPDGSYAKMVNLQKRETGKEAILNAS